VNRYSVLLALVLVYAISFRVLELNRPFAYDAEGSGCLNGVLARSYLRFDWRVSRGMPILSLDPAHATPIVFYPDHPPLVPLLIVPFYAWFGIGEWQTRLPVSLLTIATILILYRVLTCASTARVAFLGAVIFAAMPMVLYFGGFPDVVGMPLVLCVLLTVAQYKRFHEAPSHATFLPFLSAFLLAGICDWPAYVIVPILTVHFAATRPRAEWRWILSFVLAASALFIAVYAYITLATDSPWTWMVPLIGRRSAMFGGEQRPWTLWWRRAISANLTYHSFSVLLVWAAFGLRTNGSRAAATMARLLLAWAVTYAVIASKALYDHEWAWMPFTPGLAIATALATDWLLVEAERLRVARIAAWSVALLIMFFAISTWRSTSARLNPTNGHARYTPMDMGRAIRAAAPDRDNVALIVGGEEANAQLWFYGDRALRTRVWSVQDFEDRLRDQTVDLPYYFEEQPWDGPATGIVFPRDAARKFTTLHAFLKQRYRLTSLPPGLEQQFEVFDLRER
jgi:hypothetical protein